MKVGIKIGLLITFIMMCGCSKYWYQEGKTFDECKRDRDLCFEELKKRSDFSGLTVDYEITFMNECMCSKGYRDVPESELPLEVKRQEPETSLHWRIRGLAGTIE